MIRIWTMICLALALLAPGCSKEEAAASPPPQAIAADSTVHHPIVANTLKGIRRTMGKPPLQKAPTLTPDIRAMIDAAATARSASALCRWTS